SPRSQMLIMVALARESKSFELRGSQGWVGMVARSLVARSREIWKDMIHSLLVQSTLINTGGISYALHCANFQSIIDLWVNHKSGFFE
ncbi:hypothetical protein, partial [Moorena sp. SIO3B2]|uniref:hypothetical protein n=1 Tax=Moorena sp. SIO3B2 TaxID=2607827 RepID=UPI00257BEBFF